jgi:hypothetical protein
VVIALSAMSIAKGNAMLVWAEKGSLTTALFTYRQQLSIHSNSSALVNVR